SPPSPAAPRPTSRSEWCGNEEPRPGHWVRAPAERGSEIPRRTLAYGVGGAPEGAFNATLFIDALQANGPFNAGWPSRRRSPAAPVARGPRTGGGRFWGTFLTDRCQFDILQSGPGWQRD